MVIHRFHNRESCLFHSIHRLLIHFVGQPRSPKGEVGRVRWMEMSTCGRRPGTAPETVAAADADMVRSEARVPTLRAR